MSKTDAPLIPSDEGFNHQITETFAAVLQADRSWTEKVCGSFFKKDGSMQIGWGLGKYINRNVMDAYAGVSIGKSQHTVRTSRLLFPTPDVTSVGVIHYEVLEPLKKLRIRLDENEQQAISFDVVFDGSIIPPFLETHEHRRQFCGYRTENDLVRYHQVGRATGWLKIDGVKHEITPDEWWCTRDHSWGLRYGVGAEPIDLPPSIDSSMFPFNFLWSPMQMEKPSGEVYSIHHFYMNVAIPGVDNVFSGGIETADGQREEFKDLIPELNYDDGTRRLLGGKLHFTKKDGSEFPLEIKVLSDTGFHLGAGLYFGYKGQHHGSYLGDQHIDGEFIEDCSSIEQARELHQIRDCLIEVTAPDGSKGWANYQTIISGEWPDLGMTAENSFI